jgi:hypothetical protein
LTKRDGEPQGGAGGTDARPAAWQAGYPELAADSAEFFADRPALARLAGLLRAVVSDVPAAAVGDHYEVREEIAREGTGL